MLEIFQLTLENANPQKNALIVVFCDPNQALEYEYLNSICIGESHNEVFHKKRGLLVYETYFHYTTCLYNILSVKIMIVELTSLFTTIFAIQLLQYA